MKKLRESGLDAPLVPTLYILTGLIVLSFVAMFHQYNGYLWTILYGVLMIIGGIIFINTSIIGKKKIWASIIEEELPESAYHVLDLGTGHANVLLQLAHKLSRIKKSMGIDIWHSADQSDNSAENTLKIVQASGLSEQITIKTADMCELSISDESYNLVVSSLAFHNIKPSSNRKNALLEALRVLEAGGKIIIVDTGHNKREYMNILRTAGMENIKSKTYGINGWWTGPWMPTYSVIASKKINTTK
ncbi:class I SAM-dependent methyltransferase [Weissella diestrammenae]|uniref:Class I SAM-dependent methyltransferase n=1 Tax=Weissella diestrammenae TaxID=1162633 RepID=A0A7G9T592_9LACO|nr:class I SAM-dependent methyltransferase [Weissella diestrammenae]MCM0583123.1 class I SAM-dependent methyltransferase [Weissella diestrammenae]QNN75267.1 class I SAM-dependent methyltransferase [Weissella diestrammenae]